MKLIDYTKEEVLKIMFEYYFHPGISSNRECTLKKYELSKNTLFRKAREYGIDYKEVKRKAVSSSIEKFQELIKDKPSPKEPQMNFKISSELYSGLVEAHGVAFADLIKNSDYGKLCYIKPVIYGTKNNKLFNLLGVQTRIYAQYGYDIPPVFNSLMNFHKHAETNWDLAYEVYTFFKSIKEAEGFNIDVEDLLEIELISRRILENDTDAKTLAEAMYKTFKNTETISVSGITTVVAIENFIENIRSNML